MENNLSVDLADVPGDDGERKPETVGELLSPPKTTGRPRLPGTEARPCRHCAREYSLKSIKQHERRCQHNPRNSSRAAGGAGAGFPKPVSTPAPDPELTPAPEADLLSSITSDMIAIAIAGLFDVVALRAGEHWKLEPIESEALGVQWKNVLDAYAPRVSSKTIILIFALVGSWAVLGPRIKRAIDERAGLQGSSYTGGTERNGQDLSNARVA